MQTSYSERIPVALAGADATMRPGDSITRQCGTAAGIGFGLAVSQGTEDDEVIIGGTAAGFVGLSKRDVTLDPRQEDEYRENENMAVKVKGDLWVLTGGVVEAGQAVYFNGTTGVLSATSGGNQLIAGARWMTSAGSGELATVHLG